ncbi:uroporphyrinogen decarboxylase family protein [Marispirochaeta sp.]|uniref:uroporphyrinogen decarboxylase family protein n=1 Tax=Marispirochaeta sp. TaxID=2038653 RepID=UPI0029C8037B|nr:uroporphyrinogen decarboxylase family protein [Marispirochaeta sp.]
MSSDYTIEDKKKILHDTWLMKNTGIVPFMIELGPFHAAYKQYVEDDQAELEWNINYHREREAFLDFAMPNIKPNLGIGIVAEAFGCKASNNEEADPWIKPRIKEENRKEIKSLEVPDAKTNPAFVKAYQRIEYLQSKSDVPLRLVNVPSPLVTASLIWEYTSFIGATMLFPDDVHLLMEKVTEATIAFVQEQLRRIKNLYTMGHEMWHIPRDIGIRISDDTAALMSPNLYREFGVTYNNMISRAFGGIVVHSCGDVQNVVIPMMETEGLSGLDFTIPQNPNWEIIRDAAAGKVPLCLRHFYWDHGDQARVDLAEYTGTILDYFGRRGVLIQTSTPDAKTAIPLSRELAELCL